MGPAAGSWKGIHPLFISRELGATLTANKPL